MENECFQSSEYLWDSPQYTGVQSKGEAGHFEKPPKKKMKLMRSEGPDVSVKIELDPQGEAAQSANESKTE